MSLTCATLAPSSAFDEAHTHDFTRQGGAPDNLVSDRNDVNAVSADKVATKVITSHAPWAAQRARELGARVWDPAVLKWAGDAQRYLPVLRTLDRVGNEIYDLDFHPAYHQLMDLGFSSGVHSLAWTTDQPSAHSARCDDAA